MNRNQNKSIKKRQDPTPYPKNMLPGVDYSELDDDLFGDKLVDLEYETMSNLSDFIDGVKNLLLREKMVQLPEFMVSYLCAYLGFFVVVGLGKQQAESLEPGIKKLLETEASEVYQTFRKYKIQKTEGANENLQAMREASPGSIIPQTMRLGRVIYDAMEELRFNRDTLEKQTELFCPQEDFLYLLVDKTGRDNRGWRERFSNKILYAVNQVTMQIAWIMGYFAYMDKAEPTEYLKYGVPMVKMYGEAVERMSINFKKL